MQKIFTHKHEEERNDVSKQWVLLYICENEQFFNYLIVNYVIT